MCGIVGFTGEKQAAPILLDVLLKLKYRGYDSADIVVRNSGANPEILKATLIVECKHWSNEHHLDVRLINECRQSGMTDADWCRENDIAVSTFYNWVSRCRKAAADQILPSN